jgi:hypothetical protein
MVIIDIFFILILALILTGVFAAGFRRQGFGAALLLFFLILFLGTWAAGAWIPTFGPYGWGVPWLAYLIFGIFLALILIAFIPPERPKPPTVETGEELRTEPEASTIAAWDALIWVLLIGLVIAIVISYF